MLVIYDSKNNPIFRIFPESFVDWIGFCEFLNVKTYGNDWLKHLKDEYPGIDVMYQEYQSYRLLTIFR